MIEDERTYLHLFEGAGHCAKRSHGRPDFFAHCIEDSDSGPHCGPVCRTCGLALCMWCVLDNHQEIPKCNTSSSPLASSLPL